ncbi:hypothetical protein B2J96_05520 [Mycobacterium shigaense]|nr:hypothetical protein B2J96_05520 [Mycobacterium shigaense]
MIDCGAARLHVHTRSTATVLRLEGEVDVSNADLVGAAIGRFCRLNAPLVLDLSQLGFLGIAGFRMLLVLNDENRAAKRHCSVVGGSALRLLTRVFIDHGLPVIASVPEAIHIIEDRISARQRFRSGAVHQAEPQRESSYAAMKTIRVLSAFG